MTVSGFRFWARVVATFVLVLFRFAGLLLVPKVCAESSSLRYKEIYDTLGLDFLWRLLVPLRDPRFIATIDDEEEVQKQLLGKSPVF